MITASVISHGHGDMVWHLVDQLGVCPEISQIVVTLNVPETCPAKVPAKVLIVKNDTPKGFGANHNAVFAVTHSEYYCVINPDIELTSNPFAVLLGALSDHSVGLAAPLVVGPDGLPEDSMRHFLTPWSMVKRTFGFNSGAYPLKKADREISPDWVAGMFLLFRSDAYSKVRGFDERYFMYCEDADICTRLWQLNYKVVGCLSASVIHNAQRASHRSLKHLIWHLRSMVRYFFSHASALPNKCALKR